MTGHLATSMDEVRAAAAAANAALDTVRSTDVARREQLGHLDAKLTRQLAHVDKGFAALGDQVDSVRASMSDMDARVMTEVRAAVAPLQDGVHAMHAELGEQLMELETALDTVVEVGSCSVVRLSPAPQETIALRAEALTARSDELDRTVKEALQPLLTTVHQPHVSLFSSIHLFSSKHFLNHASTQMEGVRAEVASQGSQLQHLPPSLSTDVQGVQRSLQGLLRSQSQLAARVDKTAGKADVQAAVAAALQPYKGMVRGACTRCTRLHAYLGARAAGRGGQSRGTAVLAAAGAFRGAPGAPGRSQGALTAVLTTCIDCMR